MPRRIIRGLQLPIISLGPLELLDGDDKILSKGKDDDYVTTIFLILPLDEKEFVQENYKITYDDWNSLVKIRLYKVEILLANSVQWFRMLLKQGFQEEPDESSAFTG